MIQLGLTGWPLSHSRSPQIHSLALKLAGLEGEYRLYPTDPEKPNSLLALLGQVRSGQILGLNVTIPHKETVIPYLDKLSESAVAIGAVNTINLRDGLLFGDNTDAPGFTADLQNNGLDINYSPSEAIVFGAGGSARAVFHSLLMAGWQIHVFVRNVEKSRQAISDFHGKGYPGGIKMYSYHELGAILRSAKIDLVVDTTPLGMAPNIDGCAWPNGLRMPQNALLYDLVYNPTETTIMQLARSQGLRASNGWGMLVEQALLSFEIWTGRHIERAWFSTAFEQMNTQP